MTMLSKIALAILIVFAFVIGVTLQPFMLLLSAVHTFGWTLLDTAIPAHLPFARYTLFAAALLAGTSLLLVAVAFFTGKLSIGTAIPLMMGILLFLALVPVLASGLEEGDRRPPDTSPSTRSPSLEV